MTSRWPFTKIVIQSDKIFLGVDTLSGKVFPLGVGEAGSPRRVI